MSNIMRWRYGQTNPVTLQVEEETCVEIGDLIWREVDYAKPASSIDDIGRRVPLLMAQRDFRNAFAGVAMQRSVVGDIRDIRVATSGVFEFDCDKSRFDLGQFVGAKQDGRGALEDQGVVGLVDQGRAARAIGRVARQVAIADTKVLVDIDTITVSDGQQAVTETLHDPQKTSLAGLVARMQTSEKFVDGLEARLNKMERLLARTEAAIEDIEDMRKALGRFSV